MKPYFYPLLIFLLLVFCSSCEKQKEKINFPKTDLGQSALIPKPLNIQASYNAFGLGKNTVIYTDKQDTLYSKVGQFLSKKIQFRTTLSLPLNASTEPENQDAPENSIFILESKNTALSASESYELEIKQDSILIQAPTPEAAFRGVQTLLQLIPEKSNDTLTNSSLWVIPAGKITDRPTFGYRGTMLDVARHFFTVEEVKKYIDLIAYYKLNVLHLHLTDDQGWRIEVKSWPKLTEIGGKTEVGGEAGGFYTQSDYQEIVEYAAERFITIIPEIDMPGHTNAASLSYPFLDGTGKPLKSYTGTRVGFSSFNTRKDTVYSFLDDVIRELAAITPGPYIHIGGDESFVTKKKDYKYFVERVEGIVQKHGKNMIGWDEIVEADISPKTIAQHWRTEENALKAAEKGNKVILSPAKKAYLDMKYDSLSKHGLDWAGHITVDSAYIWNPSTFVKDLPTESILGIEAPLWSETISNSSEMEYLAFPRVIGYAELGWSTPENRNWEDYKTRLARQLHFLEKNNVNFYRSPLIEW
ncbi:family 20 glycosylhydrolase [Flagellimonas meridianipacifica]|uniref:beta-N-acetylhexosaminidase n=1 Tax=Flagellimonas meridianipacifica TaxID=1080225 RepID=A0A2T0M9D0_9FLAO|nr:family 20 glycosylhydrolase [Allomuricauda pacifica]PRX54114.1 hexosaminidase [Allomuricauda pacifica]